MKKHGTDSRTAFLFSNVTLRQARVSYYGTLLTNMNLFGSVDTTDGRPGTVITNLAPEDAPNLNAQPSASPSYQIVITSFPTITDRLQPLFRVSLKGTICDVGDLEDTYNNGVKRRFSLVDSQGYYFDIYALKRHTDNACFFGTGIEVILYFVAGTEAMGSSPPMMYLYDDGFIVPLCQNDTPPMRQNKMNLFE